MKPVRFAKYIMLASLFAGILVDISAQVTTAPQLAPSAQAPSTSQPAPVMESPRITPHDRLVYASEQASLDALNSKPWHLKLDVIAYDAKGEKPQAGTIERWHQKDADLTVMNFGPASLRRLDLKEKSFESKTENNVPVTARLALQEFLNPGPSDQRIEASSPVLQKKKAGNTELDCIMLQQETGKGNPVPFGTFPTYCLSQENDVIRASYSFNTPELTRNGLATFMGKDVALNISLARGAMKLVVAKSTNLSTFTPADGFFEPDATMKEVPPGPIRISGGVISGMKLSGDAVHYPDSAKVRHVQGSVLMHAIIGKDGHIQSLEVIASPDMDLSAAAVAAVRTWTYKPYLLQGKPVDVDTNMTVNFNLNMNIVNLRMSR